MKKNTNYLIYILAILLFFNFSFEARGQGPGGSGCYEKYRFRFYETLFSAGPAAYSPINEITGENGYPMVAEDCQFLVGHFGDPNCKTKLIAPIYIEKWYAYDLKSATGYDLGYLGFENKLFRPSGVYVASDYAPFDKTAFMIDSPGIWQFALKQYTPVIDNDFNIYFAAIRKIITGWVEASPICNNWTPPPGSNEYKFNIKTTPDITDIMYNAPVFRVPDGATGCTGRPAVQIKIDAVVISPDPALAGYSIPVTANFNNSHIYNDYRSEFWPTNYSNPYGFSIPYDLQSSGMPCLKDFLFGNLNYGKPLQIQVKLTDGVGYTDSHPLTFTAPLIIVSPPSKVEFDINTICAPGYSTPAVNPKYNMSVTGGLAPFNVLWSPFFDNNVTLNDPSSGSPTVTSIVNSSLPYKANYMVHIRDAAGCIYDRHVVTKFIKSGFDLASKDSYVDMYDEPNSQLSVSGYDNIWASSDIWNRYIDDGATSNQPPLFVPEPSMPTFSKPNYLYTKVRNIGCDISPSIPGHSPYLSTYWTVGGFGGAESWPTAWTTGVLPGTGPIVANQGMWIANTTIPPVYPGAFTTIRSPWGPPNPQNYATTYTTAITGSPITMDICFLSRIVDYHNPTGDPTYGMTTIEETGVDPSNNVRNNNNIATMNTSIMWAGGFPRPRVHDLLVGNIGRATDKFSLSFSNMYDFIQTDKSFLSDYMNITVYLGDLFDKWIVGGAQGKYQSIDQGRKSVTFDGSHEVRLDGIEMEKDALYHVYLVPHMLPGADGTKMKEETIYFRQISSSSEVTGGYSYEVKYNNLPNAKGVLAVTEISQGPKSHSGCQYAEMIVGNCGAEGSLYVDVDGWILDDNSGNFNATGCAPGAGITNGHFRLKGDIWKDVPVGSRIVVYNAGENCYNLPDTVTTDDSNHIYWVPVPLQIPANYVLERFNNSSSGTSCVYCDGKTDYTAAFEWNKAVYLESGKDAFQVRCPGCSSETQQGPAFYHGVGYAVQGDQDMQTIPADKSSLGGPVLLTQTGENLKYSFVGTTAAQLGDPQYWSVSPADAAGATPSSIGDVSKDLYYAIYTHTLGLPCCGDGAVKQKGGNGNNQKQELVAIAPSFKVFPNPANTSLFFSFSAPTKATVQLTDVVGRVIGEKVLSNNSVVSFDLTNYAPGLYLYQVTFSSGMVQSGKVVVNKD